MPLTISTISTIDVSWVSAVVAIVAGFIGATVGFGRRNTALSDSQSKAVDAAALQIVALQQENAGLVGRVSVLESQHVSLTSRLEAAEAMATSRELILAIASYYECPETVLAPYRTPITLRH